MSEIHAETHPESRTVLNRLLRREQYSLANYLLYASPWVPPGREHAWEEVWRIAEAQRANAEHIGQLLIRRRVYEADPGPFPVEFTSYNDLSLEFLVQRLIDYEQSLIAAIEQAIAELHADEEGRRVAQAVLAVEKKHLDALTGLAPTTPQHHERQAA